MSGPSDAELMKDLQMWLAFCCDACHLDRRHFGSESEWKELGAVLERARDRLAALTAAGAWTGEPPKVPGWWWFKPTDGRSPFVVRVSVWPGGGLAYYDDKEGETFVPGQMPGEWRGPLSPDAPPPTAPAGP